MMVDPDSSSCCAHLPWIAANELPVIKIENPNSIASATIFCRTPGFSRVAERSGATSAATRCWLLFFALLRVAPQVSPEPVNETNILSQYSLVFGNCLCDLIEFIGCKFQCPCVGPEVFNSTSLVVI